MSMSAAATTAWIGTATTAVLGLALLGSGVTAQARAATAADLAALAGADALAAAHPMPCVISQEAAARNSAQLTSCQVHGRDVVVAVAVEVDALPPQTARARAGPGPTELPTGPDEP